ncbi:hypothetical protein [Burkholderia ubonensis]|uniref:hypothetical protein n=1 Tax=Burkholderia ubonensis TaxID=101571 RepID=UPI0018AD150F|nr:hypothetical protein [Burkholderia ubonensis]
MALRPARKASRTVGTSLPILDAMPIPVMTARLMSRFPQTNHVSVGRMPEAAPSMLARPASHVRLLHPDAIRSSRPD